jgi:predicted transglutaminase-like protease
MNKGFSCIDSKSQLGYELYFKYLGGNIDFKILYLNSSILIYTIPINLNKELHILSHDLNKFSSELTDLNLIINNTKPQILNEFQILLRSKNIPT